MLHTRSVARRGVAGLVLAIAVASSGLLPSATIAVAASESRSAGAWQALSGLASVASALVPTSMLNSLQGVKSINAGSDGRLTFLLLGSDTRGGGFGRTDTIMIASLDLGSHKISMASIPRDTAKIPKPDGSGTYKGRINALLKKLKKSSSSPEQALDKLVGVIEKLLGGNSHPIEIDYYALVTFGGFNAFVKQVEPVAINTGKAIKDKKFWDDPNLPKGVFFPGNQNGYQLWEQQPANDVSSNGTCNGLWKNKGTAEKYWCRRALPYVRSRKGANNSDFVRARRQQDFVLANVARVIGLGTGSLSGLLNVADQQLSVKDLRTDFPYNGAGNAIDLFNDLKGATLDAQVVFKPKTYAKKISGSTAYKLKLAAVRAWADAHLR